MSKRLPRPKYYLQLFYRYTYLYTKKTFYRFSKNIPYAALSLNEEEIHLLGGWLCILHSIYNGREYLMSFYSK